MSEELEVGARGHPKRRYRSGFNYVAWALHELYPGRQLDDLARDEERAVLRAAKVECIRRADYPARQKSQPPVTCKDGHQHHRGMHCPTCRKMEQQFEKRRRARNEQIRRRRLEKAAA